jgi:cbb3-type cytochrome oxidase subunit 3
MLTLLLDETAIIGQAFGLMALLGFLVYVGVVWFLWTSPKGIIRTLGLTVLGIFTLLGLWLGFAWFG